MNEPNKATSVSKSRGSTALRVWEHHIHSFVELCTHSKNSELNSNTPSSKALDGITVGIKDIIDVKGVPTRNGSDACIDARAATADATVVASLRSAGAQIIGKTTTTEFAFTDPTNCRNPYDVRRSPGGSSSGSGAAVAASIVDLALGTQTAGSLCRPAAYCGVIGLKPTYGVLPTTGVTPLAKSFDSVGVIAKSVNLARKGFLAMTDDSNPIQNRGEPANVKPVVVNLLLPTEIAASDETLAAFHDASNALTQQYFNVKDLKVNTNISDIVSAHRTVMNAEAAEAHKHLLHPERVSLLQPNFRAGLEAGVKISAMALDDAHGLLLLAKEEFWSQLTGVDIALTLAVPDAAPLMDGTTGFQDWLTPWTVFGGPLVCLPWGLDSLGRPKSIMVAAHPGQDYAALAIAELLEKLAPLLPAPIEPPAKTSN